MRRSSSLSPPSSFCSSSGVCTVSPAVPAAAQQHQPGRCGAVLLHEAQLLWLQPVVPQGLHQLRRALRPVHHIEPPAAAQQIRRRAAQVVRCAGQLGARRAPLSRCHSSAVGREVRRIGRAYVKAIGTRQGGPVPQVGAQDGDASVQPVGGGAARCHGAGGLVHVDVRDAQVALPSQKQQPQQANARAQVAHPLAPPHGGKAAQQERVGGGLEGAVAEAEAQPSRPQLIPAFHGATSK